MFTVNEDGSIYATRGDIAFFTLMAEENGVGYIFQPGDVLRMKIFQKKNPSRVLLSKSFLISEASDRALLFLSGDETKFGPTISKPTDYWYEIEHNPATNPQTIIGYDADGPKVFRLFPEGADG